ENLTFVYLDETWIYQNGSSVRHWIHESDLKSNPIKIKNFLVEGAKYKNSQYNPIEMAWRFYKSYYNKHINSQPSSKDKENLIPNQMTITIIQTFMAK
ncbi:unnamed protein product, partial [Tenebrio molitor]